MSIDIQRATSYIVDNIEDVIANATGHLLETIKEAPSRSDFEFYITEEEYIANATINIFDVLGTTHPDYIGHRWIDMLRIGKRMHINLPLLKGNPDYYLNVEPKYPIMSYSMFNGELYLTGDGNHRTAIAKVFFSYIGREHLSGVALIKYAVNTTLKEKIDYVKQLASEKGVNIYVDLRRRKIHREDKEGWHKDTYTTDILINGKQINPYGNELDNIIDDLKKYNWFYKTFPFLLKSGIWRQ
ncbi:hypothetical protein [Persephonella sp.]